MLSVRQAARQVWCRPCCCCACWHSCLMPRGGGRSLLRGGFGMFVQVCRDALAPWLRALTNQHTYAGFCCMHTSRWINAELMSSDCGTSVKAEMRFWQ